jgi:hypothetical protein
VNPHCESPWGIFDCVGNLHEWGSTRCADAVWPTAR